MPVIEDVRLVIQDLVAPDLKAIDVRLTAVERRLDGIDSRIDRLEGKIDRLDEKMDCHFAELRSALDLDGRLRRVEEKLLEQRPTS